MAGNSSQPGRSVTIRALTLLSTFDATHQRQTLSEMSRRSGFPLTTTHRLVGDLEEWGAVERDADGSYHIGLRLWELGMFTPANAQLRELAMPYMQELYETTRENVHLAVRDRFDALYLDRLSGHRSVPVVSRAGSRLPMHATAVGKALLAHQSQAFVQYFCQRPLSRNTRYTITEPGRLVRELAEVRRRGYAQTVEEMTLGACSVAVPIRDNEGVATAAVGIVVHSVRADLPKLVPSLMQAAQSIEELLRNNGSDVPAARRYTAMRRREPIQPGRPV
ncbi:IclR family transcriptional regulator [Pseudonocardiaceae bacterium YIM PH 21723]|nr:IclR family transcriptional regulator [Pseudonocardiaceae bacterium YIM PH 21723]